MKRRTVLAGAIAAAVAGVARAASAPRAADDALRGELAAASGDHRAVLILFHGSWCGWCRLFDLLLADPRAGPVIDRYYRVFHVRAQERTDAQRALQMPDADALYARYAPPGSGLPFFAVLDPQGAPVATAISPKTHQNVGFPVTPEELDHFESLLRQGAPAITAAELATVRQACVRIHDKRR